ncbi:hypothetical protein K461DRAFT_271231 [Myriangium duriaei CBS 260.36]|uniref:Rhodopsin domain-containing protein n=1 Tax=Myriangium duriaei CBS 260.36 TaxID=1168546 RepID=A0A9P4MJC8_9PEZI|nr:hypothetical protein K461DRAFT_271231 [Myriangium duriaei CBS 260.36]
MHVAFEVSINTLALVLTTACVGLRLYVRRTITRSIGIDDYILVMAQLVSVWGVCWAISTALTKCALAAFFIRVVPKEHHRILRGIMVSIAMVTSIYLLVVEGVTAFQCGNPFRLENATEAGCLDVDIITRVSRTTRAILVATDWIMTIIPAYVVWRSAMPFRSKLPTILIIMLGSCASILCVLRYPFEHMKDVAGPQDVSRWFEFSTLAMSESCLGIIVISLAGGKPLLVKLFKKSPLDGSDHLEGRTNNIVFLTEFRYEEEKST